MEDTASSRRPRIVVIGGGINGLAAAWSAWEASGSGGAEVLLLEAGDEVGGKARTRQTDGWLFEEGPTGYLAGDDTLADLVRRARLTPIEADPIAARRYVVRGGKAREIRLSPLHFAMSGILSPGGILRLIQELKVPPRVGGDESVWDFAARRLGPQAADRLIAPMVLGIYAGDAKQLSLPAAFPKMAALEREHGGLFKGMFAKAQLNRGNSGGSAGPGAALMSFEGGLQSLPIALAERARFDIRCGARVSELARDEARSTWRVRVDGDAESVEADRVVLSCDAHTSARLLEPTIPAVSRELAAISIPGIAVVGLGYTSSRAVARIPVGFGALIPRGEGFRILGCLFDTQLFPGRSPDRTMLVRCMIGGATDPEAHLLSDGELLGHAIDDLRRLFRLKAAPETYEIARWNQSIPQYELGHLERVSKVESEMMRHAEQQPGLHLAGCHAAGVAFGKTAAEGWRVGERAGRLG